MKLVSVKRATRPTKKYTAVFSDGQRQKSVSFGAAGYDDYTTSHDTAQRDRYRQRHAKDLLLRDPTKPGYLSYYLLWGPSTSLQDNITAYKKRFNV